MNVFVTRAHLDTAAVERVLEPKVLAGAGWHPIAQIRLRPDWERVAEELIKAADALLFVTTPYSVISRACLKELSMAIEARVPCRQWLLTDVRGHPVPEAVRSLRVSARGSEVDPRNWFDCSSGRLAD